MRRVDFSEKQVVYGLFRKKSGGERSKTRVLCEYLNWVYLFLSELFIMSARCDRKRKKGKEME